jgi:sugar phosphate isomerase/epimerase
MRSWKNAFPFRTGTTSYIYPVEKDNLLTNVRLLMGSFDKIQLLFFGRDYLDEALSPDTITGLRKLKEESGVRYSIHLPADLGLLSGHGLDASMDIIARIISETGILDIENFILHIDPFSDFSYKPFVLSGQMEENFGHCLQVLDARFGNGNGQTSRIMIENTSYDLTRLAEQIKRYRFPVCFDIGHLFMGKGDFQGFTDCFSGIISEVHLHGFSEKGDHGSLDRIGPSAWEKILGFLGSYRESLILEVFNETDLMTSLKRLEQDLPPG